MKKMNGKVAWGLGCLVELVLLVVAVVVMDDDGAQMASFLLYMAALAIPAAFVRRCLFSESTPTWIRVGFGPAGALACLVLAYFMPINLGGGDDDEIGAGRRQGGHRGSV